MKSIILQIINENRSNFTQIIKANYNDLYNDVNTQYIGNNFSEKLYRWLNRDKLEIGKCMECGNNVNFIDIRQGFRIFCSIQCQGTSEYTKKLVKEGTIKKFGVENVSQSKYVKDKKEKTFLDRYGVKCAFNFEYVKEKVRNTPRVYNEEKREHTLSAKRIKFVDRCLYGDRLGNNIIPLFNYTSFKSSKDRTMEFKCKKCERIIKSHLQWGYVPICKYCEGSSKYENEVIDYIKTLGDFEIIKNSFNIIPFGEIDIYIPKLNVAIEFNGDYWHSIKFKDAHYHLTKTKKCETMGIKLIHIQECEWLTEPDKIKTIIKLVVNKLDFSNFYDIIGENKYKVNRKFFNRATIPFEYRIMEEYAPELKPCGNHQCYNCGYLIIER